MALLGPTVAVNLFGDDDPVGRQIRIERAPFQVIGVTTAKGLDLNGVDQDDLIIVPLRTAMWRVLNLTHVQADSLSLHGAQAVTRAE